MVLTILLFSCSSSKNKDINYSPDYTSTAEYKIIGVDTTKNYYLLNATNNTTQAAVKIVVEKKSKQIKNQKISINNNYKLSTYGIYDLVAIGNYSHYVEGKRVWTSDEKIDLRFTDSMGNEKDTIIDGKLIINGKHNLKKK